MQPGCSCVCSQHHLSWRCCCRRKEGRKEGSSRRRSSLWLSFLSTERHLLTMGAILLLCTLLLCTTSLAVSTVGSRSGQRVGPKVGVALRNASVSVRARYPLYMLQLYRSLRASEHADAFTERSSWHRSDSVLSLTATGCHQVGNRWTLTFDMSSVSTGELLQLAELRLRLPAFSTSKQAMVEVFHSSRRPQSCELGGTLPRPCRDQPLLLGSFSVEPNTSESESGWKVFNVTTLLESWLHQRGSALEEGPDSEPGSGAGLDAGGGSFFATLEKRRHHTADRVMMVIFSKVKPLGQGDTALSLMHTVESSKYVGAGVAGVTGVTGVTGVAEDMGTSGGGSDAQSRRQKRNRMERIPAAEVVSAPSIDPPEPPAPLCRRVDMWVDFELIGWDEWIVHPKRYNAFRCEGQCPTPLDETFSPTNHAYMQSLLRHHHPQRGSCPSCVPTRLSPLSMLYFERDDLALRHHEDMVVEECGCH